MLNFFNHANVQVQIEGLCMIGDYFLDPSQAALLRFLTKGGAAYHFTEGQIEAFSTLTLFLTMTYLNANTVLSLLENGSIELIPSAICSAVLRDGTEALLPSLSLERCHQLAMALNRAGRMNTLLTPLATQAVNTTVFFSKKLINYVTSERQQNNERPNPHAHNHIP